MKPATDRSPSGTRAPLGERTGNRLLGYWRFLRHEGRTGTNVIVFFVAAVFLILTLIITIFRVQPRYKVEATFADSGGVFTGQEVTYRGVTVGRVGNLHVVADGVRMDLVIEKKFDRIPKDGTKARVMFKSAVGEQFVDLEPVASAGPYFTNGDEIALADTALPVQQEDLLRLLDKVLSGIPPKAIGDLVGTLGQGLGGRGAELHGGLAALDPLTKTLASRTNELNSINVNADTLGTAFDATAPEFVSGIHGLGTVSSALGRGSDGLANLFRAGSNYLPDVDALVAGSKLQLETTIKNLALVTRISYAHLQSVADTLDWLPVLLDTLVESYDPATNRFRFGQIQGEASAAPCSYGTPRRTVNASGNASYQPILDFHC